MRRTLFTYLQERHIRRVLAVLKPSATLTSLALLLAIVFAPLPQPPPVDTVDRSAPPEDSPAPNPEPISPVFHHAGGARAPLDGGCDPVQPFIGGDYITDITYEVPHTRFSGLGTRFALRRFPAGKLIYVDVARQRLWCLEDRRLAAYFVVSTGADGTPTPPGDYEIGFKIPYAVSRDFYEDGETKWWGLPYYMDIGGYGFHAVPSLYMKQREPLETLGRPVSHRCIRLGHVVLESLGNKSPARWLYEWAEVGTPVLIRGEWGLSDPTTPWDVERCRFSPERGFYLETEGLASVTPERDSDS
jgi:hypothetical protein